MDTAPHNAAAERAVIASILRDPVSMDSAAAALRSEDFYAPGTRRIFNAMIALHRKGDNPGDLPSLVDLGCSPSDVALLASEGGIAPIEHHAAIVAAHAMRRRVIAAAEHLADVAANTDSDIDGALSSGLAELQQCYHCDSEFLHISASVQEWAEAVAARRADPNAARTMGVPTSLKVLNEKLTFGGIPTGGMTMIGGQSGGGKTALANNVIALPAALAGYRVAVCSLEDSRRSVAVRNIAALSDMPNRMLQREEVGSDADWRDVCAAGEKLSATELYVLDTPPDNVGALCSAIKRHVAGKGADVVIVDFVQYVDSGLRGNANKTEQDEFVLKSLAILSRSLADTALVVLSQYRDIPEHQEPCNNDLRGAKVARHFAHTILHVWATATQVNMSPERKTITVGKQKQGPCGNIEVCWEPTRCRFSDA